MIKLWVVMAVFLVSPAWAQTAPDPERTSEDRALVETCAHELAERQGSGGQGHAYTVSATEMERPNDTTVRVRLALTSGEGRLVQGTCVFRNGKLFDVRK